MAPLLKSSLEVEDALLKAGTRLGMRTLLLRCVAAELPDNPWLLDLEVEEDGPGVIAGATHLCGSACAVDVAGCLTAFKIEDAVTKRVGRVMGIQSVQRDGAEKIRVRLEPVLHR